MKKRAKYGGYEFLSGPENVSYKHGMSGTSTYTVWWNMMQRCYHAKDPAFSRYGGRGIVVEKYWHEFKNFFSDMGERPAGKSLDRIDNNGPYSKSNCRWASMKQQNRNRRDNRTYLVNGKKACIAELCEDYGKNYSTVMTRIYRGWSIERALGLCE